jgi:uncharacterized spore protein YtfJ
MNGNGERAAVDRATAGATALIERVVRQVALTASAEAVFGRPVEAHGRTVIPVAKVYFAYGGGAGPELAGRTVERQPDGRVVPALSSGGGGGGVGVARPAGYIELSAAGTRFVPVLHDWRRTLALAGAVAVAVLLLRLPARRQPD